jgi:hypothetical protein
MYEQLSGLLGLEGFTVTSVEERGDELDLEVELVAAGECCRGVSATVMFQPGPSALRCRLRGRSRCPRVVHGVAMASRRVTDRPTRPGLRLERTQPPLSRMVLTGRLSNHGLVVFQGG